MCFQQQDVIEEPQEPRQKKPRTPESEVAANAVESQWCYTSLPPLRQNERNEAKRQKCCAAAGFAVHSFCCSPQLVAVARTHLCHAACHHEEIGNSNAMELKYRECQVKKLRCSSPGCCSLIKLNEKYWEVLVLCDTVFGLRKTCKMGKFTLREAIQLIFTSQAPAQGKVIRPGCANNTVTVDKSCSFGFSTLRIPNPGSLSWSVLRRNLRQALKYELCWTLLFHLPTQKYALNTFLHRGPKDRAELKSKLHVAAVQ